jgi:thiol-disulfide isomerase/thioredoxin
MCRVAAFLLVALLMAGSAGAKGLQVGDVPPDALGRDESGAPVKLGDYRGKVVIISFWASWCPACRKELPALGSVQKVAGVGQLQVLAVNYGENRQRYREIVRVLRPGLQEAPIKLISDTQSYYGTEYGVKALPHMVLIGRDGRIAAVHEGYGESEIPLLVKEINQLLLATPDVPSGP